LLAVLFDVHAPRASPCERVLPSDTQHRQADAQPGTRACATPGA